MYTWIFLNFFFFSFQHSFLIFKHLQECWFNRLQFYRWHLHSIFILSFLISHFTCLPSSSSHPSLAKIKLKKITFFFIFVWKISTSHVNIQRTCHRCIIDCTRKEFSDHFIWFIWCWKKNLLLLFLLLFIHVQLSFSKDLFVNLISKRKSIWTLASIQKKQILNIQIDIYIFNNISFMKFLFSYILQQVYRIDFYQDNFRKKKIFEKKKRNLLTSNIKSKSYFESNHFICFQHSQNILNPQIFVNIPNESISHREIFQNDSFFFSLSKIKLIFHFILIKNK